MYTIYTMAPKILTKRNLRILYGAFIKLPPFNQYRMPAPHKIQFAVFKLDGALGYFHTEPCRIELDVSNDTWHKMSETLLHEMIHLCRYHNGKWDFDTHNHNFNSMAQRICDIYAFDIDTF